MNFRYHLVKTCTWLSKVLAKLYSAIIQPRCYFLEVAIVHVWTSEAVNKLLCEWNPAPTMGCVAGSRHCAESVTDAVLRCWGSTEHERTPSKTFVGGQVQSTSPTAALEAVRDEVGRSPNKSYPRYDFWREI